MELFLLGAALAFSINIELGVVNVMIVRTAIDRGAWPAFLIGLGSCIGDLIWACAGALGVSVLLSWEPAAWILWLGGSGALCWFAAAALRDAARGEASTSRHHFVALTVSVRLASGSALRSAPHPDSLDGNGGRQRPCLSGGGPRRLCSIHLRVRRRLVAHSAILSGVVGATRRFTGPRTVRAVSLISALMFAAFAVGIFMDGARRLLLPLLG